MDSLIDKNEAELGRVTWLSSEEDGGPDCGLILGLGGGWSLAVSELADATLREAGVDPAAHMASWWVQICGPKTLQVIGPVVDQEAARDLLDRLADTTAELTRITSEVERLEREAAPRDDDAAADAAIASDLAAGLDQFNAAAAKWLMLAGVDRMVKAITSVFAKWTNDDLMSRFQQKVKDLMHQAFIEGAVAHHDAIHDQVTALIADNAAQAQRIADLEGGVHVDLPTAVVVERAFLPTNPNKMRSAAPGVVQAANRFKDLVRATLNATPKEG